jgi:hypothetical protein
LNKKTEWIAQKWFFLDSQALRDLGKHYLEFLLLDGLVHIYTYSYEIISENCYGMTYELWQALKSIYMPCLDDVQCPTIQTCKKLYRPDWAVQGFELQAVIFSVWLCKIWWARADLKANVVVFKLLKTCNLKEFLKIVENFQPFQISFQVP